MPVCVFVSVCVCGGRGGGEACSNTFSSFYQRRSSLDKTSSE